jgi:peptidoglycan hydrolase-like protein with peptidoglycan-binding domain
MKKITEKQLMESVRVLRDYTDMLEGMQQEGVMDTVGKWAGNAAGSVSNAVNTVGNAIGSGVDAVKQGVNDFTSGAQQAYNTATAGQPGVAAQPASTNKWPTTPQEIIAFQQANGLKPDGAIGPKTMQALASKGIQPPAGFQMAGPKKAAAPAKPVDIMAQTPDEAEDERIAQNTAFYNMTPQQQAMYNTGTAQQKPAAQPAVQAATPQPGMQQGMQAASAALPTASSFASQQPVKESSDTEMSRFRDIFSEDTNLQEVKDTSHVTFQQENSLARIIQLSHRQ